MEARLPVAAAVETRLRLESKHAATVVGHTRLPDCPISIRQERLGSDQPHATQQLAHPSRRIGCGPAGMSPSVYRAVADLVLLAHAGFVAFVVLGQLVIVAGGLCGWRWVRNPWFRLAHLAGIGLVVVQSWLGAVCPLTRLENRLRDAAGDSTYDGTFIAHWVRQLLFFEAPSWVFTLGYGLFGLLVVATWLAVRPRPLRLTRTAPRSAA
jgi:hypothetical protein